MAKKKKKRQLGAGYYHPQRVAERLADARARGRRERVRVLSALLAEIKAMPPVRRLTKSWRSEPFRNLRANQMRELRKSMTLQQVGDIYGLSRERVRKILEAQNGG